MGQMQKYKKGISTKSIEWKYILSVIEKRIIFMNRVKERREFYQKTEILLSFFLDNARNEIVFV